MSANVKAEAILIVIKRVLKWIGFALLAGVVLAIIHTDQCGTGQGLLNEAQVAGV